MMKMENCKFKRIVEMVESTATNSEVTMMKKRKQLEFEESETKRKQQSPLNYDEPDKCITDYAVSCDGDVMTLRSVSGHGSESNCVKDAPRCCQIESDCSRSVDFELKSFETENSTPPNNKFSLETTPVSEIYENTTESMETPAKKSRGGSSRKPSNYPAVSMPLTAEIDEFFSKAEKYDQNRFAEKYNYDVAKDLPMDGRYEWIRLKP